MFFENVRIKDITNVIVSYPNIRKWSVINRRNHIIGVQTDGHEILTFKNKELTLSDNCIYFFNQKDDYSVEVLEKGYAFSVHFTTYEDVETESFIIKLEDTAEFWALIEKIRIQHALTSKGGSLMLSCLYRLIAKYEDICNKTYFRRDMRLLRAKNFIDLNFKEKDCLEKAANTVNVSRRRFNDLFKNHYNITPNRYIVLRKIELAKSLLKENALSVSEVADMCGFSDVYYFSKTFKAETCFTPTEYKKMQMR